MQDREIAIRAQDQADLFKELQDAKRKSHGEDIAYRMVTDMIADDYGIPTPMRKVVLPNYLTKKGSAFTYEEEKKLINPCLANLSRDTSHASMVVLYTGMRRSELASLNVIDGTWLE